MLFLFTARYGTRFLHSSDLADMRRSLVDEPEDDDGPDGGAATTHDRSGNG